MQPPHIDIAPELLAIVSLGVLYLAEVRNGECHAGLDAAMVEAERAARNQAPAERMAVRAMYRRVGLDPTKRRPSSEALLRRVQRGEPLPRVNPLVDVCNWCSLELQLPYGLYDLEHIQAPIALRLGTPGEEYAGIRKDVVHVGGRLTLADAVGAFGNPTSDSARTMVTPTTTSAMAVIFAPRDIPPPAVEAALRLTCDRAQSFTGAREVARFVV